MFDNYRQDCAERKLPILNLLTVRKSGFYALEGRLVAAIHVKLGMADGQELLGPLVCAKFPLNWCTVQGMGIMPQNIKNSTFW